MKIFLFLILFITTLFSKECYWDKKDHVCFKRYYDTENLENPNPNKKYYTLNGNKIYTFTGKIKLKLKYSGAIMYLLDNFDIDISERNNHVQYEMVTNQPYKHLSIITSLNNLDAVKLARPILKRIYKKGERPQQKVATPKTKKSKPSKSSSGGMGGFQYKTN